MSTDRTDTDRLNWLVKMGYIPELRRLFTGGWIFETDESEYEGVSERDVIDLAMKYEAEP